MDLLENAATDVTILVRRTLVKQEECADDKATTFNVPVLRPERESCANTSAETLATEILAKTVVHVAKVPTAQASSAYADQAIGVTTAKL